MSARRLQRASTTRTARRACRPVARTEVLAATIAGAVERQLTQYVSAMAQQVDAARQAVETSQQRAACRVPAAARVADRSSSRPASRPSRSTRRRCRPRSRSASPTSPQHQQLRLNEVENRILEAAGRAAAARSTPVSSSLCANTSTARAPRRMPASTNCTRRRVASTSRRRRWCSTSTTPRIALTQRMDDGNQALASAVEERLGFVRTTLEAVGPEVQRQLAEHDAAARRSASTSPSTRSPTACWRWKSGSTSRTAPRSPTSKPRSAASAPASTTRSPRCRSACSSWRTSLFESADQHRRARPSRSAQVDEQGDQRGEGAALRCRR